MRRSGTLPRLLAPAGSEDAFYAALAAGADAVYLGGKAYNARAFAPNFDGETLSRCIAEAHARGVEVYVTLNTLLWERELEGALAYATELWSMGVDALICADIGLITLLRRHLPEMPVHASTQVSLHSATGAEEVEDLGFEVVVLAREVDREGILEAVRRAKAKVEVFVHGALCVCHSGQCLFSSLVGGRSGNRGECAQPCRLPYGEGYPLSLKDLCLASHIPALIESGVECLKIEGRMKSAAYVWGVTRIYRRLLDEGRAATPAEIAELKEIFSRDGFTDGYYTGAHFGAMTGVRREADKEESRQHREVPPLAPVPLTGVCEILLDAPARLTLSDPLGRVAEVTGDVPSPARSAPLTEEGVKLRLSKTGGTPYALSPDRITLRLGEGLNLSPASLNGLRRRALDVLLANEREPVAPAAVAPAAPAFSSLGRTALFVRRDLYESTRDAHGFFDVVFVPLWEIGSMDALPAGVWLPPVIMDGEEPQISRLLEVARARGARYALCGGAAQVSLARRAGLEIVGDFRLNITNSHAAAYWREHGVTDAVLSPELTLPRLRALSGRLLVYGRIPMMLTERCYAAKGGPQTCGDACRKGAKLVDRRGIEFPILSLPPHRNQIFNSIPTYLCDRRGELPRHLGEHYLFTVEEPEEVREVLDKASKGLPLARQVRRLPK